MNLGPPSSQEPWLHVRVSDIHPVPSQRGVLSDDHMATHARKPLDGWVTDIDALWLFVRHRVSGSHDLDIFIHKSLLE